MRLLLTGLLVLALAAPFGLAQQSANPLCVPPPRVDPATYCTYDLHYLVMGRILDVNGLPAKGAQVLVTIDQAGVKDGSGNAPTQSGLGNCKGDFEFDFAGLRRVLDSGKARVTIVGDAGGANVTVEMGLDSYYRRSDFAIRLPYAWPYECTQKPDPAWDTQLSVKGRLVNRSAPYEVVGETYHATLVSGGVVGLRWYDGTASTDGRMRYHCPPDATNGCAPIPVDDLGNYKYTWTFPNPIELGGWVEVVVPRDGGEPEYYNLTIDREYRLAMGVLDISRAGPPPVETPGLGAILVLAAGAVVALSVRRR